MNYVGTPLSAVKPNEAPLCLSAEKLSSSARLGR
jgi:hypothetical protein